ncbi:MAG: hypothetical protein P1U41_05205 [Vicingaceae bacterium]|nr:hypothetical protein [Vicingaceae bacterium]
MQNFTHFDLQEITKKEKELKMLLNLTKEKMYYTPKKETINNILNYSKALSIRKSKQLDFIELILN